MFKFFLFFFAVLFTLNCFSQKINQCYKPIEKDMGNGNWEKIDNHLDSMYMKYSDSIVVPFTLWRIGRKLYEIQDFERLYKYSKLMLEYDHEN